MSTSPAPSRSTRAVPSDHDIGQVLRQVQLGPLLDRVSSDDGLGLDTTADWASILSLGEQQRLAFARYHVLSHWLSMLKLCDLHKLSSPAHQCFMTAYTKF